MRKHALKKAPGDKESMSVYCLGPKEENITELEIRDGRTGLEAGNSVRGSMPFLLTARLMKKCPTQGLNRETKRESTASACMSGRCSLTSSNFVSNFMPVCNFLRRDPQLSDSFFFFASAGD